MKPATEPATLTSASFEDLIQEMLVRLGEDPQREASSLPLSVLANPCSFLLAVTPKIPRPC